MFIKLFVQIPSVLKFLSVLITAVQTFLKDRSPCLTHSTHKRDVVNSRHIGLHFCDVSSLCRLGMFEAYLPSIPHCQAYTIVHSLCVVHFDIYVHDSPTAQLQMGALIELLASSLYMLYDFVRKLISGM